MIQKEYSVIGILEVVTKYREISVALKDCKRLYKKK
jgi:hypothetical protein